jgi:hypothetical protein
MTPEEIIENPETDGARYSGRSTRLIDSYIQGLFMNGTVTIKDHQGTAQSDRWLADRVMRRLSYEHRRVRVDRTRNTITIVQ